MGGNRRFMNTNNTITKKLIKHLKDNGVIFTPSLNLQIILLDSAVSDYKMADSDIKENGIKCVNNNGKTIGQNPAIKTKLDNAKLIIKLLKELGLTNDENEEVDNFIKSLTD